MGLLGIDPEAQRVRGALNPSVCCGATVIKISHYRVKWVSHSCQYQSPKNGGTSGCMRASVPRGPMSHTLSITQMDIRTMKDTAVTRKKTLRGCKIMDSQPNSDVKFHRLRHYILHAGSKMILGKLVAMGTLTGIL